MMDQNRSYIACMVLLFVCTSLNAQNFRNSAVLDAVTKTGFYSIHVTPELSSYTSTDYRDMRIEDEHTTVPYIIKNTVPGFFKNEVEQLKIVRNEIADSGKTVLIVENPGHLTLTDIALTIRNAAVSRTADISGSDNLHTWFTIAEEVSLEKKFSDDNDRYVQHLGFPLTTYQYIRIIINNNRNLPLNIIQAARYRSIEYKSVNPFVINPAPTFTRVDSSNGTTYINVNNHKPYHVTSIILKIRGPVFFKREMDIILKTGAVYNYQVTSDSLFKLDMPVFNDTTWLIEIYNGDNPPLVVTGITTEQERKEIVAYFEIGKQYRLLINNPMAVKPVYDLQNFADSISANLPHLGFSAIKQNNNPGVKQKTFFTSDWLWPVLIIVLCILTFFTWHLAKDMQKKT